MRVHRELHRCRVNNDPSISITNPLGISIPTTLLEAGQVVRELKDPQHPKVPIAIFLTPLASLKREPISFLPNLSNDRIAKAERVVRHVESVLRRLKNLDRSRLAQLSMNFRRALKTILRHFEQNREDLKRSLLNYLPLIETESDKIKIAETELVETMKQSYENKTNVFLNTLEAEADFLENYMRAVKECGLQLAHNDAEARMAETRTPLKMLDQVVLHVNFALSLPENPLPRLELKDNKTMIETIEKMTTGLSELVQIKEANKSDLSCLVTLHCDQEENIVSWNLLNQEIDLQSTKLFKIKDLRIEDFVLLGTFDVSEGQVEIKVEEEAEGREEIQKFPFQNNLLQVPLELLSLTPNRKHEVQIRLVTKQGVRGSWFPSSSLKILLPPGFKGRFF